MRLVLPAIGLITLLLLSSEIWALSRPAPVLKRVPWVSAVEFDHLWSSNPDRHAQASPAKGDLGSKTPYGYKSKDAFTRSKA